MHPLVTPPTVGPPMPGHLCMGCAPGIVVKTHRCAGSRPLEPYGGFCQCRQPGCGPVGNPTPRTAQSNMDRKKEAVNTSRAKIAAQFLLQSDSVRTSELADRMFPPAPARTPERDRQLKKVAETLRGLEALGLIARNTPEPGYCRALDRDGLRHVARVGVAEYARQRRPR